MYYALYFLFAVVGILGFVRSSIEFSANIAAIMAYFFGMIFFVVGIFACAGSGAKVFGIFFLFSHGGIGYYLMELRDGRFEHYNEYGIDPANPFNGLFLRAGKTFKYTLNHTKRVGYSLDETIIRYQCGLEAEYSDPLPVLLGCGEHTPEPGPWLGDIVDAADELPLGYDLLKEIYLDW